MLSQNTHAHFVKKNVKLPTAIKKLMNNYRRFHLSVDTWEKNMF